MSQKSDFITADHPPKSENPAASKQRFKHHPEPWIQPVNNLTFSKGTGNLSNVMGNPKVPLKNPTTTSGDNTPINSDQTGTNFDVSPMSGHEKHGE